MRQNLTNQDIRQRISAAGLKHYEVAEAAGISYSTFNIWMRQEMPRCDPRRIKILCALSGLEAAAAGGEHEREAEKEVDGKTV